MTANSNYQISPPDGAFQYMLLNGRSVIIFDGLDELLETNYRQEITSDIETFCTLYPSVPVIVTSREVGYEQAPLDQNRFEVFHLASFNHDQVKEYVIKWFAADTDLTPDERKRKSDGFLEESRFVPDLRSNPLILALLCNIYRGENYIPKNRPDVYEKCANMLFERWDKGRNLYIPLPFEAHIRPAMMHLAYQIYTNEKLLIGVSEKTLINIATEYLYPKRFEDRDEAETAARKFIEFCRGRAWVFTEVGSTKEGEGLYQFTHRTFLEYFAASYLARIYRTPDQLGTFLFPRIARREWDVVAQLAFQIQNKQFEDAGDELLSNLLSYAEIANMDDKLNMLSFAARCLEFMIPSPKLTRDITAKCIEFCLDWINEKMESIDDKTNHSKRIASREVLPILVSATTENLVSIENTFREVLIEKINNKDDHVSLLASQVGLNLPLCYSLNYKTYNDDAIIGWHEVSNSIFYACYDRIYSLSSIDIYLCSETVLRGKMPIDYFIKLFGTNHLFTQINFTIFPDVRRLSLAEMLIYCAFNLEGMNHYKKIYNVNIAEVMGEIGRILISIPTPWITAMQNRNVYIPIFGSPGIDINQQYYDSDIVFGFFSILAVIIENDRRQLANICENIEYKYSDFLNHIFNILKSRLECIPIDQVEADMGWLRFNNEQKIFLRRWVAREINLVDLSESDQSL